MTPIINSRRDDLQLSTIVFRLVLTHGQTSFFLLQMTHYSGYRSFFRLRCHLVLDHNSRNVVLEENKEGNTGYSFNDRILRFQLSTW